MKKSILTCAAIVAALTSCSREESALFPASEGRTISIEVGISEVRTSYDYQEGSYKVFWTDSDKLYVQDSKGTVEQFTITSISPDKKKAVFSKVGSLLTDGPVWCWTRGSGSEPNTAYAWQQNLGWGMGSYDCMSGEGVLENGSITGLDLIHDIAILRITGLKFGALNGTITQVLFNSPNLANVVKYNKGTKTYVLSHDLITCINAGAAVTDGVLQKDLYIAFFPQKTSEAEPYSLVFTLDGKTYSYEWTATKKYQAGTMYTLKDKSVDVSISQDDPISFADPAVKAICVAKFDTNSDKEVSYAEAAAVTGWSNYFRGNKTITSFREFKYFTGLKSLGFAPFQDCSNLKEIELPPYLTTINEAAFQLSGITSISIPETVTSIEARAFNFCTALQEIVIPASVTSIGNWAFRHLDKLNSFTCLATVPPAIISDTNGNTFLVSTPEIPIKVPAGSVDAYKAAAGWNNYASRITAL